MVTSTAEWTRPTRFRIRLLVVLAAALVFLIQSYLAAVVSGTTQIAAVVPVADAAGCVAVESRKTQTAAADAVVAAAGSEHPDR